MNNWKMWSWFTPPKKKDIIEVKDNLFNPTRDLVDIYKIQLNAANKTIDRLCEEKEALLRENLILKSKNVPVPEPKVIKHFNTFSGLKAELEVRSREEKRKQNEEVAVTNSDN